MIIRDSIKAKAVASIIIRKASETSGPQSKPQELTEVWVAFKCKYFSSQHFQILLYKRYYFKSYYQAMF